MRTIPDQPSHGTRGDDSPSGQFEMNTLHLPLKAEYFDAIKNGTKLEEYRLATPYWRKRLEGRIYHVIMLTKGYPKRDDRERRLVRFWKSCALKTITHPHFGPDPVEVFAIWVGP